MRLYLTGTARSWKETCPSQIRRGKLRDRMTSIFDAPGVEKCFQGCLGLYLEATAGQSLIGLDRPRTVSSGVCKGSAWGSTHGRPGHSTSVCHCSCRLGCLEGAEPPVASKWFQCADGSVQNGHSRINRLLGLCQGKLQQLHHGWGLGGGGRSSHAAFSANIEAHLRPTARAWPRRPTTTTPTLAATAECLAQCTDLISNLRRSLADFS